MESDKKRSLSDHPIVVLLGIISSILAIFVFISGYDNLSSLLTKKSETFQTTDIPPIPTHTNTPKPQNTPTSLPPTTSPTQDPNITYVKLTLVTGDDGTVDIPIFELFDNSGEMFSGKVLFSTPLNHKGDFQPNSTATYTFTVPYNFCKFVGWHLSKPATSGVDDSWLVKEIYIELNGEMVYFDRVFSDQGSMSTSSPLPVRSGNWAGTDDYKQQCSN